MLGALIVPIGIIVIGSISVYSSYQPLAAYTVLDNRRTKRGLGWAFIAFGVVAVVVVVGRA